MTRLATDSAKRSQSETGDRINIASAAKMVNKAPTTIRRLVDLGTLKSTRDETGKHWILRQDLIEHYSMQAATVASQHAAAVESRDRERIGATAQKAPVGTQSVATVVELATLRERVAWLEKMLLQAESARDEHHSRIQAMERKLEDKDLLVSKTMKEMAAFIEKQTGVMGWFRRG